MAGVLQAISEAVVLIFVQATAISEAVVLIFVQSTLA